jgi:aryl-alcohol dehydrogenase-like predicted oxidoreductase
VSQLGTTTRSAGEKDSPRSTIGHQDNDKQIIERVEELAKRHGWKMSVVALAWINKRITSPIIGFSSVERMDEALEAIDKILTDEEEKYLMEPYQPREINGHV